VNVSSIHSIVGFPNTPVYDACKGGIDALTRQLCVDYATFGIRSNSVLPGAVLSDGALKRIREAGTGGEAILREMSSLSPSGGIADADDVSSAIEFLLSDSARAISGASLVVDFGATARCHIDARIEG
jgi:NAD(P)-dependent dehydrogenase (short-subunit alcohol dehydrogenase family)